MPYTCQLAVLRALSDCQRGHGTTTRLRGTIYSGAAERSRAENDQQHHLLRPRAFVRSLASENDGAPRKHLLCTSRNCFVSALTTVFLNQCVCVLIMSCVCVSLIPDCVAVFELLCVCHVFMCVFVCVIDVLLTICVCSNVCVGVYMHLHLGF